MKMNIVNAATQHSRVSASVATALTGITSVDVWVLKVLPELLSVAALVFSLVLSIILIRYHLLNTGNIRLENEKKRLEIEILKSRLKDDINLHEVKEAS